MSRHEYIVLRRSDDVGYVLGFTTSDPYDDDRVKTDDQKLHQTLIKIFGRLTSRQIKKLVRRAPKNRTSKKSVFGLILEEEPVFGEQLQTRSNLSLLWIAVLSGHQESAELLLRSGADVNELYGLKILHQRLNKKSSLLHAVLQMYPSAWNERFVALLMDHGANLKARDVDDCTPLHEAIRYDRVKGTQLLLEKGADANAVRIAGITPLLEAALNGQAQDKMIPLLMRHGADITARCKSGLNVLRYLACSRGDHVELARVFIEKGISPRESLDSIQSQPIHAATSAGNIKLVNLFLDHGANVNAQERVYDGRFPLLIAVQECKDPSMLLTLLKRGASIDMKTSNGHTALHGLGIDYFYARPTDVKEALEKLKILLSVGADMFVEAHTGNTPFELLHNKNLKYAWLLLKTMALRKACLQPSSEFKDERILKEKYPHLWDSYQVFVEELNRIKSTKFVKSGAFFDLLTKCQCQVVGIMRFREFRSKFRTYDFSAFPTYAEDMIEAFERAEHFYHSLLDLEDEIDEGLNNTFPYTIVRKIAGYASKCETCETKQIVHDSKQANKKQLNGTRCRSGPNRVSRPTNNSSGAHIRTDNQQDEPLGSRVKKWFKKNITIRCIRHS